MEYDDMRAVLRDYNWDDGFGLPGRLLDQPGCDLALALEIFYLADGFAFLSDSEGKSGPKEWRDFKTAKGIQIARILSRFTVLQMRWPLFFLLLFLFP